MITLSDALDGVKDARGYWDTRWVTAARMDDMDGMDEAMAEKRALSRLVVRLTCPVCQA